MAVIDSNENELRQLIFDNSLLMVFYHSPRCEICQQLLPQFKAHALHYPAIMLVCIDADENKVAGRLVDKRAVPFISLYKNGLLIECKSIANKNELVQSFNHLLHSKVADENTL